MRHQGGKRPFASDIRALCSVLIQKEATRGQKIEKGPTLLCPAQGEWERKACAGGGKEKGNHPPCQSGREALSEGVISQQRPEQALGGGFWAEM